MAIDNVFLLGNNNLNKVNIYSFIIRSRFGKILHPHFVTSLLNDLFGIQTRSGCACAAMYGQKILGIDLTLSRRYKDVLFDGNELFRVGYTRFNIPYFFNDDEINYVLDALEFVAKFGWMFLPAYKFDLDLGIWKSRQE
jgi:selenocysteine lyase/cysteine desulfurase